MISPLKAAPAMQVRLGTRGSALALTQADLVVRAARGAVPELVIEPVTVRTEGDSDKTSPLTVIGGRGVFTSGLQDALLAGQIDAAVHSAKDLPSEQVPGLAFAAFLAREDPRDVFVSRHGLGLAALPPGPTIGTSSRRRAAQVQAVRPDARIVDLRGNVDTRLRKARQTDLDGIVLAAAGVARMGWQEAVTEYLPLDTFVPSPGQGALAVEVRATEEGAAALLSRLDDPAVSLSVRAERAFLRAIGAGCTTPVGAHAAIDDGRLLVRGMLADEDGERVEWAEARFALADAEAGAAELARELASRLGAPRRPRPRPTAAEPGPLAGLSVLVTRAREQAGTLSAALRARGAIPVEAPTIRLVPLSDPAPLDRALAAMAEGAYDWVVFTSGNAVGAVHGRLAALGFGAAGFARVKVAAVGEATAARLAEAGVRADLVPERFTATAMVAALTAVGVRGARVLLPQGSLARETLAAGLRSAGAAVEAVEAYRTVPAKGLHPAVRERLLRGEVDVAIFASPSALSGLAALLGGDLRPLRGVTVACMGPTTAAAARAHGLRADVIPEDSTVEGLVAALVAHTRLRPPASSLSAHAPDHPYAAGGGA